MAISSITSVIILLGILVFVHELGHFLAAKYSGVGILKFSLGFGPRLLSRKLGETEYMISLVPLGGYVKMLGESDDDDVNPEDESRSFHRQSIWKKIAIVAAGPLSNFFFAIIVFSVIYGAGVPVLTSKVGSVQEGSAAASAGLREGDRITAIDGRSTSEWVEMAKSITESGGKPLRVQVERGSTIVEFDVMPRPVVDHNIFGEEVTVYRIGISASSDTITKTYDPWKAASLGAAQAWTIAKLTVLSVVKMVQGIVSPRTIGGPIVIAKLSGEVAQQGLAPFFFFMAVLSVNLAILNLFPIPVLDGGHLLFYFIELVTGREINIRWRERAQQVGFFILILLMVFIFGNDLLTIWGN
ncbi:MAG: RIP metalloprotease RseP [Deltaproteobacteria bacterium]|nr:RIP metalloprotease RseP [Deltaproteobacteria bacterium]